MPISDYMRSLREKIGPDLIMMPAVTVFVFDEEGRLLVAQESGSGLWMTIGGAMDPDESPADAAVRECWEETGLHVEPTRLVGAFGGPRYRITYANGDVVSYTTIVFEARVIGGSPRADGEEATALRFVTQAEAAGLPMAVWTGELVRLAFKRNAAPTFDPPIWTPPS
jgi:8-oxo-dGTP pyrophosphatase MutT (NUDIX family)